MTPRTSSDWPKTYVVTSGDSLEKIAKKYYGAADGVKPSSIDRIFEANKGILKSRERLSIGQKLTIPAPAGSGTTRPSVQSQPALVTPSPSQGQRVYIVKDGDSLWKIAESQLGKGTRYKEIFKLNTTTLKNDEDTLEVGMKLNLPGK